MFSETVHTGHSVVDGVKFRRGFLRVYGRNAAVVC